MNSEPARLCNNSRFPLSLILDHSSNRVISLQLCLVFPNTVLFLVIIFFLRCDQVPFSDHFTRSRPRTHCSKDDQSCKYIFSLTIAFQCTYSYLIHSINCVSKWFKVLRSHFCLRSVCRSTLKRSTRLNLLLKGSVFAIRTKKKGLHSRQRFQMWAFPTKKTSVFDVQCNVLMFNCLVRGP